MGPVSRGNVALMFSLTLLSMVSLSVTRVQVVFFDGAVVWLCYNGVCVVM